MKELRELHLEKRDYEEFASVLPVRRNAERVIQLIIELSIDIGNYIISQLDFRKPESYKDTFDVLEDEKVITRDLAVKMKDLVDLRNQLVHIYWRVDTQKLFEVIKGRLGEFEEFSLQVTKYVERVEDLED